MARRDDHSEENKPATTGLDSYRRLIELQRQMIALSQQYEQTRRECDALRDEVVREVADQLKARRSIRHRLHQSAIRYLRLIRGTAVQWYADSDSNQGTPPSVRL